MERKLLNFYIDEELARKFKAKNSDGRNKYGTENKRVDRRIFRKLRRSAH